MTRERWRERRGKGGRERHTHKDGGGEIVNFR